MQDSSDSSDEQYEMENADPKYENILQNIVIRLTRALVPEEYGIGEYWETRYTSSMEEYEWFQSWNDLYPHIEKYLISGKNALNIGCGNSPMSYQMIPYFSSITSNDISKTVIDQMKERYSNYTQLIWNVMDCRKMAYQNSSFDYVFDKGTLDALYCSENSIEDINQTFSEISRILKPEGYFISISFGDPKYRSILMKSNPDLHMTFISHESILSPKNPDVFHHLYVLKREK